jgi:hypothetical protein
MSSNCDALDNDSRSNTGRKIADIGDIGEHRKMA